MSRIRLALIIVGCVMGFFGIQEMRLAGSARSAPQTLTCAELAAKGPGDNAHIVLTDFEVGENFVCQTRSKNSSDWELVYLPAMPKRQLADLLRGNANTSPTVIIKTSKVRNEQDIMALGPQVQGLVINKISSLGSEEKTLLSSSYPGANLDKCWIVEQGRQPAGMMKLFGLLGGAVALLAVGLLMLIGNRAKAAS